MRHDPATGRFALTPGQATVLADESSPAFAAGIMALAAVVIKDEERLGRDAVRTGAGIGWHEHHPDLFHGTERLFKPGDVTNLTSSSIPALDGVEAKLRSGASVADCARRVANVLVRDTTYQALDIAVTESPRPDRSARRGRDPGLNEAR